MPTVRINDENEAEALGAAPTGAAVRGDVARVSSNVQLADHIGKFVAGEITHRYAAESLADTVKGKNAIHVSISWG